MRRKPGAKSRVLDDQTSASNRHQSLFAQEVLDRFPSHTIIVSWLRSMHEPEPELRKQQHAAAEYSSPLTDTFLKVI
jgi:hypothetical protein